MTQINILLMILLICLLVKMKYGFQEGFSKGLYRIVVTVVSIGVIYEVVNGVKGAITHDTMLIVKAVVSLLIILFIYKIINLPLTSLKLMAKTPGVHFLDKIAGIALGFAECMLLIWVFFFVIDMIKYEPIRTWTIEQANANNIMAFLYHKNYIKEVIDQLVSIK